MLTIFKRPKTVIQGVTVYNLKTNRVKLKRLGKYLNTKVFYNNGALVLECKKRAELRDVRYKIAEILEIKPHTVNLTYYETKR